MAFPLEDNYKIYLIIPSYNEGTVLRSTLSNVLSAGYNIILVDDGSTDNTKAIAESFNLHYLRHEKNMGQGASLQTGMDYARSLGADIVVHFDADGQHRVSDIPAMIEPIIKKQADIVLGSRFLNKAYAAQIPGTKKIILRCARLLDGLISGIWLTDSHNGFRALGKNALKEITFQSHRMGHASEILLEIRRNNLNYYEAPVFINYCKYSNTKKNIYINIITTLVEIFSVIFKRIKINMNINLFSVENKK